MCHFFVFPLKVRYFTIFSEVNMKLKDWLDAWTNGGLKYNIKKRSLNTYLDVVEKHIKPKLGEYELDQLNIVVLQSFIQQKLEKGNLKTGGALSSSTVVLIANILKQAIYEANLLEITSKNYAKHIRLPYQHESSVTAFEKLEQEKIVKYCAESKKSNYIGIIICLYTGLRIGELLALEWKDVDFDKNLLSVTKSAYQGKINGKIKIIVDTPKTKNSHRVIPLPKQIVQKLKKIKKKSSSKYIITTKNNQMVGTRSYQRTFERILCRLNICHKNFHSLRHTFATRALEFGMDVKTVSEILGHKNPMITLQRYTHSLLSYKRDMMNKFGRQLEIL